MLAAKHEGGPFVTRHVEERHSIPKARLGEIGHERDDESSPNRRKGLGAGALEREVR